MPGTGRNPKARRDWRLRREAAQAEPERPGPPAVRGANWLGKHGQRHTADRCMSPCVSAGGGRVLEASVSGWQCPAYRGRRGRGDHPARFRSALWSI